jgi:hypothetical protein
MMQVLGKVGFTQSYTYFTWREDKARRSPSTPPNSRAATCAGITVRTSGPTRRTFCRAICKTPARRCSASAPRSPPRSRRAGACIQATSCAKTTLIPARRVQHSEKYELKQRDYNQLGNISAFIRTLNLIRRDNPAMHLYDNLSFHGADHPQMLCYSKVTPDFSNRILCVISHDPHQAAVGMVHLDLAALGLDSSRPFKVTDLMHNQATSGVERTTTSRSIPTACRCTSSRWSSDLNFTARLLLLLMILSWRGRRRRGGLSLLQSWLRSAMSAGFVIKQITGPAKAEMKLVFFDEKHCLMRVASNADSKTAKPLDEIGRAQKAVAVCNGGYFHAGGDFGPAGLEIANGTRTDKFTGGEWVGGIMVKQGKAALIWESEFQDSPDIAEFIQCSPWLVSDGRVVPVPPLKEPDQRNHRTFIMTDGQEKWAIGVCKRVGWLELAHILITPGIITEMKVKRALNLDGGPSTGLWCMNEAGTEHFEKPGWAVRNAIVVIPRDSK